MLGIYAGLGVLSMLPTTELQISPSERSSVVWICIGRSKRFTGGERDRSCEWVRLFGVEDSTAGHLVTRKKRWLDVEYWAVGHVICSDLHFPCEMLTSVIINEHSILLLFIECL